ncbi:histidinol-phosphatase HisJ [Bacillus sp. ISL-47]|uniref:histidinol-phosphatase HisJ n=1 Tax=Bacillus sp. ISL-47 TaxID=2819130 RepID=UPI001BEC18FB|nr:histidinol-phosphatase HisJ [Bacillus sp. ISL-47]MBT2690876.1 histidinol-phosphatase HisJ [Bacillus sp. ISL-47]MBT2709583.1 histidinol-phosphatase HisJ [Pseudomonas sp. ISL-84]
MIKDGHIHTSFCPHGTKDPLEDYVEKALELGFKEISFTEHAPLPESFIDPAPASDSAMRQGDLEQYFEDISRIKAAYRGKIKINAGLEVDFIEGFEQETKSFLNNAGKYLDDSILSVHFLKHGNKYECLDYSPEVFGKMIEQYGSIEALYTNYFRTLLLSVRSDLGLFKPKRIGHITLVKKFQKKYPINREFKGEILQLLEAVKMQGYELDYNGAGYSKPLCREPYPPDWVAGEAVKKGIPLIYGSDAHQVKEMGQGRSVMKYL